MHQTANAALERVVREFAEWRGVPEDERVTNRGLAIRANGRETHPRGGIRVASDLMIED